MLSYVTCVYYVCYVAQSALIFIIIYRQSGVELMRRPIGYSYGRYNGRGLPLLVLSAYTIATHFIIYGV